MNNFFKRVMFGFLISVLCVNVGSAATGAFAIQMMDSESFGKANAFTGEADTPAAVYFNPAGLMQLKDHKYFSMGITSLTSFAKHRNNGVKTDMDTETAMIPHIYYIDDFGVENMNFGIGLGSDFGSVTDWGDNNAALSYVATRSALLNKDLNLVTAFRVLENLSFGLGLKVTKSKVSKSKKILQSGTDADFNFKGSDVGYGYSVSSRYEVNERHAFGLKYQSKMDMQYKGVARFNGLSGVYATYAGGSSLSIQSESALEFPQSMGFGYSYKPNKTWILNMDVQWTDFSSVQEERLIYKDTLTAGQSALANTGNPVVHNWKDSWSYAVGVENQFTDELALRFGYYFHQNSVGHAMFDNTVPDADKHGITLGIGYKIREDLVLDLAYSALFFENRTINNNVGNGVGGAADGVYEQWINIAMATLTWRY